MVIIQEENLKNEETHLFINNSFRDGSLRTSGIDIDAILPPVSRFGSAGAGRAERHGQSLQPHRRRARRHLAAAKGASAHPRPGTRRRTRPAKGFRHTRRAAAHA